MLRPPALEIRERGEKNMSPHFNYVRASVRPSVRSGHCERSEDGRGVVIQSQQRRSISSYSITAVAISDAASLQVHSLARKEIIIRATDAGRPTFFTRSSPEI